MAIRSITALANGMWLVAIYPHMSRSLPPSDFVPLATTTSTPLSSGGTLNAHGDAIVVSSTNSSDGAMLRPLIIARDMALKSCARTRGLVNVSANTNRVSGVMAASNAATSPSSTTVTEPPRRASIHSR